METAEPMPRISCELLRRCTYHERPVGKETGLQRAEVERRTIAAISFGFSECKVLRCTPDTEVGGASWRMAMGEAQPLSAGILPWARSRVGRVALELRALWNIHRTEWGLCCLSAPRRGLVTDESGVLTLALSTASGHSQSCFCPCPASGWHTGTLLCSRSSSLYQGPGLACEFQST